jgi:sporulation protein YqfC
MERRKMGLPKLPDGPALPLVEIVGSRRVLIENHRGVAAYGSNEIIVRGNTGYIRILGEKLILARMTNQQLVICGRIHGVELEGVERCNDGN